MPDHSHLILGDTHAMRSYQGEVLPKVPDFSDLKGEDVDVVLFTGDLVDEMNGNTYEAILSRGYFLRDLKDELDEFEPKGYVYSLGNHERMCFSQERQRLKGIYLNPDRTRDTITSLFKQSSYTRIDEEGMLSPEEISRDYDVYVTDRSTINSFSKSDEVENVIYVSHRQNFPGFKDFCDMYAFGHLHRLYKDGDRVSVQLIDVSTGYSSRILSPVFSMDLAYGGFMRQKKRPKKTPGLYFFVDSVDNSPRVRVGLSAGIYGDWMFRDSDRLVYHSQRNGSTTELSLSDTFDNLVEFNGFGPEEYTLV